MFNSNKSQVATEFLMTYSWTIILVLVSVASLSYIGLMRLDHQEIERCLLPLPFNCLDATAQDNTVYIYIQKVSGMDAEDIAVQIKDFDGQGTGVGCEGGTVMTDNIEMVYNCTLPHNYTGEIKSELMIFYSKRESGMRHIAEGLLQLQAK